MLYSAERGFINHHDHRADAQDTLDSVFPLARDHMVFPELFANGYLPHKTATVLLTNFNTNDFVVDITDTFPNKIAALKAHASQIADIEEVKEWMGEIAGKIGKSSGYKYAEGFVRIDLN